MKKIKAIIAMLAVCFLIAGCGDVSKVIILPSDSQLYSQNEIDSAIKVTKSYFKRYFDGCTMTELTYAGDEITNAHKEFATRHNADEVIVLTSSFDVDASGGDGSLNPNSTYDGWMWILVRNKNGNWRHVDHGY